MSKKRKSNIPLSEQMRTHGFYAWADSAKGLEAKLKSVDDVVRTLEREFDPMSSCEYDDGRRQVVARIRHAIGRGGD